MSASFSEYWARSSKKLGSYSPERYRFYGTAKSIPSDQQQWTAARTGKFARLWQLGNIAKSGKIPSKGKRGEYLAELAKIEKLLPLVTGTRWETTVLSEMGECYLAFADTSDVGTVTILAALRVGSAGDGEAYHAAEVLWSLGHAKPIEEALA